MIIDLLTSPFLGPIKGVAWITEKIIEQAESQMPSERTVLRDLTELQLRLDLGEISEEEYDKQEEVLLQQLQGLRNENSP